MAKEAIILPRAISAERAMQALLELPELEKTPASEVKTKGWPSVMRKVREKGAVAITYHNHLEAVVMDVREYQRLQEAARRGADEDPREGSLQALQMEFDDHLAVLKDGAALSRVLDKPARKGKKFALGPSL